jgi:hypothetical protein
MTAPEGVKDRPVVFRSNQGTWRARVSDTGTSQVVTACVPPRGFARITFASTGSSALPGDPMNIDAYQQQRAGGVLFQQIALADETSAC